MTKTTRAQDVKLTCGTRPWDLILNLADESRNDHQKPLTVQDGYSYFLLSRPYAKKNSVVLAEILDSTPF